MNDEANSNNAAAQAQLSKPIKIYHLQITPQQLETLNRLEKKHATATEIAKITKMNKDQVGKIRRMKEQGLYNQFHNHLMGHSVKANRHLAGNQNGKLPHFVPKLLQLFGEGLTGKQVAQKCGITTGMAFYWKLKLQHGKTSHIPTGNVVGRPRGIRKPNREILKSMPRIIRLRAKGLEFPEIGRSMGLAANVVKYRFYKYGKQEENLVHVHNTNNGSNAAVRATNNDTSNNQQSTPPSKGELIGYAWALIESKIIKISEEQLTHFGERVAPNGAALRRRLSELLAFEEVR
jgi:hypothetical protein